MQVITKQEKAKRIKEMGRILKKQFNIEYKKYTTADIYNNESFFQKIIP